MGNIYSVKEELYSSIENSDTTRLHALIANNPELLNNPMTSDCKTLPLARAAWRGDMRVCQLLLDKGAMVDA